VIDTLIDKSEDFDTFVLLLWKARKAIEANLDNLIQSYKNLLDTTIISGVLGLPTEIPLDGVMFFTEIMAPVNLVIFVEDGVELQYRKHLYKFAKELSTVNVKTFYKRLNQ